MYCIDGNRMNLSNRHPARGSPSTHSITLVEPAFWFLVVFIFGSFHCSPPRNSQGPYIGQTTHPTPTGPPLHWVPPTAAAFWFKELFSQKFHPLLQAYSKDDHNTNPTNSECSPPRGKLEFGWLAGAEGYCCCGERA